MAERLYPQLSVASEDTKLEQELKEEKSRHRLPTPPPAYCMLNANSNPNANANVKLSASAPNASLVDSDDEDYILFTESSINESKPAVCPPTPAPRGQQNQKSPKRSRTYIEQVGQDWFHDYITTREQAEKCLKNHENGTYLVRPSESERGKENFTLSLIHENKFIHYKLNVVINGDDEKIIFGKRTFSSMNELIRYFKTRRLQRIEGVEVLLKKPYVETEEPQTKSAFGTTWTE